MMDRMSLHAIILLRVFNLNGPSFLTVDFYFGIGFGIGVNYTILIY